MKVKVPLFQLNIKKKSCKICNSFIRKGKILIFPEIVFKIKELALDFIRMQ